MASVTRPHISHALQHLRSGVTLSACVLACALLAQVVCWGVIHYAAPAEKALDQPEPSAVTGVVYTDAVTDPPMTDAGGIAVNTVPSAEGLVVRRVADVSSVVGVLAAIGLCLFLFQAVAVAGGGGVPGVEKIVTATSWAMVLAALCVPWSSVFPTIPFAGVMRTGAGFDAANAAHAAGSTPGPLFLGTHLVLPLLLVAGATACALRYRAGVENGVIVTHASMLDERLEAELRARKIGEGSTPRAVGALHAALGDTPAPAPAPAPGGASMSAHPAPTHNPSPPMSINHHARTQHPAGPPAVPPPPPMRPI